MPDSIRFPYTLTLKMKAPEERIRGTGGLESRQYGENDEGDTKYSTAGRNR